MEEQDLLPASAKRKGTVSAVMVSFRTGPVLFDAIAALLCQDELRELIIVDNGNLAEVVAKIRQLSTEAPIVLITGHGNIGFGAACNLGARRAQGELLLLINPDCIMPPGGLAALVSEGRRLPRPWLLSGCLVDPDGREQRGSRRRMLTPGRMIIEGLHLYRFGAHRLRLESLYAHEEPLPTETTAIPVISGADMMLPRDAYWAIGGMDEDYFLHVEDIDFCFRFQRAGGGVYFVPHVRVTHFKSSSQASPIFVEWHKTRSFQIYFRKHFRKTSALPLRIVVHALIIGRFIALCVMSGLRRLLGRYRMNNDRRRSIPYSFPACKD